MAVLQDASAAPEVLVSDLMASAEQGGAGTDGAVGDATAEDREIETESGDSSEGSRTVDYSTILATAVGLALTSYLLVIVDFI